MGSVTGFGPSLESPVLRNTFLRLGNRALDRASSGGEPIKAANLLVRNGTVAECNSRPILETAHGEPPGYYAGTGISVRDHVHPGSGRPAVTRPLAAAILNSLSSSTHHQTGQRRCRFPVRKSRCRPSRSPFGGPKNQLGVALVGLIADSF